MHSSALTMAGFYEKVIEDFGKKLFDKYSQKEQGFDSELIDTIKSVLLHLLRGSGPRWKTPKTYLAKPLKLSIEAQPISHSLSNPARIARSKNNRSTLTKARTKKKRQITPMYSMCNSTKSKSNKAMTLAWLNTSLMKISMTKKTNKTKERSV